MVTGGVGVGAQGQAGGGAGDIDRAARLDRREHPRGHAAADRAAGAGAGAHGGGGGALPRARGGAAAGAGAGARVRRPAPLRRPLRPRPPSLDVRGGGRRRCRQRHGLRGHTQPRRTHIHL